MPTDDALTLALVEDDLGHARLIERNLRRAQVSHDIVAITDGQEALDFIVQASLESPPRSLLVLLDLNLPGLNGHQVLSRLKTNERTQSIPVIILTTTAEPHEIETCYTLWCSAYLVKPVEYDQFVEVIRALGLFLSMIRVPNQR